MKLEVPIVSDEKCQADMGPDGVGWGVKFYNFSCCYKLIISSDRLQLPRVCCALEEKVGRILAG